MSEEQDYFIVPVGNGSDDTDKVFVLKEHLKREESTVSPAGVLTMQPYVQGGGDNHQPSSQMSKEVQGLIVPVNQPVLQMQRPENFRRYSSNSAGAESMPLPKKLRAVEDNVASNVPGIFHKEKHQNHLSELQQFCKGLQGLFENAATLVNQVCGVVSKMQKTEEEEFLLNRALAAVPKVEEPEQVNTFKMTGNHDMGPDTPSTSGGIPSNFALPNNKMEKIREIVISPNVSQYSSSSIRCIPIHIGYIGDPERNVMILKMHLINARRKLEPKHAARYLARALFSKEALVCSSQSVHSLNCNYRQPLDPNKMAAMREFLTTVFPNHDLREHGKDWRACVSYINSLIYYLCSEVRKIEQKRLVAIKPRTPAPENSNVETEGASSENSLQLQQQASASEANASGDPQPDSSAVPVKSEEPSTSCSVVAHGTVGYVGYPWRNVLLSHVVLKRAKMKTTPESTARYLIFQLFPKEVLMKSNVYGDPQYDILALNFNVIDALREFLQEEYPTLDLAEDGRDWKFCVTYINNSIRSLRYKESNATSELLFNPFIKSETSDTDYSDKST